MLRKTLIFIVLSLFIFLLSSVFFRVQAQEWEVVHYPNKYFTQTFGPSGTTSTKHIYDDKGGLIATVEGSGTGAKTHYIHTDHLGGTNVVTDESGEIVEVTDYLPFGGINTHETTSNFKEPRKYTSHTYDEESDLNYMNARYQDGEIGRFLSQDISSRDNPEKFLTDPQQFNFYSYGRNNPIRFYDPNGEDVQDVLVSAAVTTVANVFQAIDGTVNVAFHPVQTAKSIPQLPSVIKQQTQQAYSDITSGNDYDRTAGIINSVFLVGSLIAPEGRIKLADDAMVCRGGLCTADRFIAGSKETALNPGINASLSGISVNVGKNVDKLLQNGPLPGYSKYGDSFVDQVYLLGGEFIDKRSNYNPFHYEIKGLTARQLENLFGGDGVKRNPYYKKRN